MSPGVVMLDASASTDSGGEHGIVKYLWTVVSPEGMETHLEGVYVNVTFDTPGEHNVTLYVEDAGLNFDTDRVVITVLPFDSDSDGLPDEWELRHFGSLKERGTGDADVDGRVNVQEACESTDPTRADTVILPESELSGIWWLFLLVGVGVCAGIAGIVYVRRPRLKVLPRPPAGVSPPVSVATAPALAPPEDEEEKEREERELKEILEGRWSRPEDED